MVLQAGTRLGSYEVLAPIGAGGMGEVYRARDTKVGRDVAIKVLPQEFAADPDRLVRFRDEARAASALSHPNIVTVFDVDVSGPAPYLVLELLEGRTLRELLAEGPLPAKRLLDVAVQAADGLAKAHQAGLIHRDLKPENLMVTHDGFVKILDFGLAKLAAPREGPMSDLPTAVARTATGVVVGTAGYMSPEQAAGRPLDFRSDQFALGSILYELATGRRAFQRETAAETLTAILREEPEAIGLLSPRLPPPLCWTIERCLSKDPEGRFASTRDLATDLRNLRDRLQQLSSAMALAPTSTVPARRSRLSSLAVAALVFVVGAASGAFLVYRLGEGGRTGPPRFTRLTYRRGSVAGARFASDGKTVVYAAAWDGGQPELSTTRSGGGESRSMGLPPSALLAISSRDEMAVILHPAFVLTYRAIGTLAQSSLSGGAPRELLTDASGAAWHPDGRLAVVRGSEGRDRIELPVGTVLYQSSSYEISDLRFSPDGAWLAFFEHSGLGTRVSAIDRAGKLRVLSQGWAIHSRGLAFSPRGDEVWFTAARGDEMLCLRAVTLSGVERLVLRETGSVRLHDVSATGQVILESLSTRIGVRWKPSVEETEGEFSWLDGSFLGDISPDGSRLAFSESERIYVRRPGGSDAVRVGEGYNFATLAFSPDGNRLLAVPERAQSEIHILPIGAGEPRVLKHPGLEEVVKLAWLPDGHRIAFVAGAPGAATRVYVEDLATGSVRPITPEKIGQATCVVSPDGRRVATLDDRRRLSLYPVDGDAPAQHMEGEGHGLPIRFSDDGRYLYVYEWGELPATILRFEIATRSRSPWKTLMPSDPAGVWRIHPVAVTADGRSYAFSYSRTQSELFLVDGLR